MTTLGLADVPESAAATTLFASMDPLSTFGLFAVTAMLVTYALEERSPWFVLAFGVACILGSAYGFLQGAWPFGIVEAVWSVVAFRRFRLVRNRDSRPSQNPPKDG